MNTNQRAWEHTLLAMAQQGLEHEMLPEPLDGYPNLDAAYAVCDALANEHSHTFYMASRPLPEPKRKAVRSLYAFCRITDDLIDRSNGNLEEGLAAWRACAMDSPRRATTRLRLLGPTPVPVIASRPAMRNSSCRA